jgi:MFS family permease
VVESGAGAVAAALRWYLASTAAFLVPGGIQMVLFPWLVVVLLEEPAARFGIAQMTGALPALCLILLGGVVGDRFDQRRIMLILHLAAALPPLMLAVLIGVDALSYSLLLGFALVNGVIGAFAQPARDALLSRVAGAAIQRTVTLVISMQFGVQILGLLLASSADRVGPIPLLVVQAVVMAAGALAVARIRIAALPPAARKPALAELAEGIALVVGSERLRPIMLLSFAMSAFFGGTYMVLIPLIARDVYHGGAPEIGTAYVANMIGTVAVTLWLVARGGVGRPGRAVVVALASGSLVLVPLYFGVSLEWFYALVFLFGVGGGVVMSMSRTIAQESAPVSHRARVMSVFSLGMMGGMPLGALARGYLAGVAGATGAVLLPVIGMALVVAIVVARSDLWGLLPRDTVAQV